MKAAFSSMAQLLLLCGYANGPARAYDIYSDPPGSGIAMNLELGTAPVSTSGYGVTTWNALAQGALTSWNQAGIGPQQDHGFFTVRNPQVSVDPCVQDGVSEARFVSTLCGLGFGSALAVTYTRTVNGKRVEADVVFDSKRAWDAYTGPLHGVTPDFRRVALHEFGHVAGLDHPDEVNQTVQSVMNSQISNTDTLQQDDITGVHLINWYWFSFPTRYGVALNTSVTSNAITLTGITAPASIGITGGEYSINGGAYTSVTGTVVNGQTVTLRVTSSRALMTAVTATLNIGGASGDFSVITTDGGAPITANTSTYSPLTAGSSRSFRKNGVDGYVDTVLAGTTTINGVATKAVQSSEGNFSYSTSDGNGIRAHRDYEPHVFLKGLGYVSITVTFSPPILDAPAIATMGQDVLSSGTANYVVPEAGINANLSYSSKSTLEAFETITVPAGTFNTVRVNRTLNLSGSIEGAAINQTITGIVWVASGIGDVKQISASGDVDTYLLTGSSLPADATPNAFSFTAQTGIQPNTMVVSNTVTVSGINAPAAISITGGEYSINGGNYTSASGTANDRDTVSVRLTAGNFSTTLATTLTIGGVSGNFSVATVDPPDSQPPSVPASLTASAISTSQVNLAWTAAIDNVGVTQYKVYRGGVPIATLDGLARGYGDIGLTPLTTYSYTVLACDARANCSAQSGQASATTLATGQFAFSPQLESGFNLGSNALNVTLNVLALFGNQETPVGGVTSIIVSLWKWNAVDQRWAFYSPQLTVAGNAAYAASHNYDALATVNPGEGFWMNAINPITLPPQSGTTFTWNSGNFPALPPGFNLIATADSVTPSQFNNNVSATPPSPGGTPTDNFVSLWVWDAVQGKWYFYSPLLEASGGLPAVKAYADSHNYLHFQDAGRTLGVGSGFWVNRP